MPPYRSKFKWGVTRNGAIPFLFGIFMKKHSAKNEKETMQEEKMMNEEKDMQTGMTNKNAHAGQMKQMMKQKMKKV